MRHFLPAIAALLASASSSVALAQTAGCSTAGQALCGAGSSGAITQSVGQVRLGRGPAFSNAAAGATVGPGDRVVVGEGSGVLALGPSCAIPLQSFSIVQLSGGPNSLCATSMASPPAGAAASSGAASGTTSLATVGAYVAGAALIGGGVAAALATVSP